MLIQNSYEDTWSNNNNNNNNNYRISTTNKRQSCFIQLRKSLLLKYVARWFIQSSFLIHTVAWDTVHWCFLKVSLIIKGMFSSSRRMKLGDRIFFSSSNPLTRSPSSIYPPIHLSCSVILQFCFNKFIRDTDSSVCPD